ncbi:hypothetical protein PMAYCL1PPCAC_16755, partial [Pristionchus mayeri]
RIGVAALISISYLVYRFRNTSPESKATVFYLRITTSSVALLMIAYCWFETPDMAHDWALGIFGFLPFLGILCGYLFCLVWNGWPVGSRDVPEPGLSDLIFQ